MQAFTDAEIDEVLRNESDGVMAFAAADEPYAVPVSYGYDGRRLVFQFGNVEDGRKMSFLERNPRVCFVVYDTRPDRTVESVVLTGEVERVPETELREAFGVIQSTAAFPLDGSIWGHPPEESGTELLWLDPDERSGRAYGVGDVENAE